MTGAPAPLARSLRGADGGVGRWTLRIAVAAVAIGTGLAAWVADERSEDERTEGGRSPEVRIVGRAALTEAAGLSGHPVYWVGPMPGTELQLSEGAGGDVQVSYPMQDAEVGSEPAGALSVGSYPLPHPARALAEFAAQPRSRVYRGPRGLRVVTNANAPGSAYFTSPDGSVQVEVFDPVAGRALRLVLSGRVRPAM